VQNDSLFAGNAHFYPTEAAFIERFNAAISSPESSAAAQTTAAAAPGALPLILPLHIVSSSSKYSFRAGSLRLPKLPAAVSSFLFFIFFIFVPGGGWEGAGREGSTVVHCKWNRSAARMQLIATNDYNCRELGRVYPDLVAMKPFILGRQNTVYPPISGPLKRGGAF
jgi:hypothetical protein